MSLNSSDLDLKNSIKNVKGKRIQQSFLTPDQTNLIAGQTVWFKGLLLIFIFSLYILSGVLLGVLGEQISINIVVPYQGSSTIFTCVFLSILSWGFFTLSRGFLNGWQGTIIVTIAIMILLKATSNINLGFALLFTPLYLLFAILAVFTACLSLYLVTISFKRYRLIFTCLYSFLVLMVSTITAYKVHSYGELDHVQVNALRDAGLLPAYVEIVVALLGLISGLCGVIFSLIELSALEKHQNRFDFLWSWAIALSAWGGTSFYNLDLSEINFSGSRLANSDFRGIKFNKTCLLGVTGLDRARVDNRYFDLDNLKVQQLLTRGTSEDRNFSRVNLQGAYLKEAAMRKFNFIEANLHGADLHGADLKESLLARAEVTGVNFSNANLTGICIEDWNINSQTCFTNVQCDYLFRKLNERGEPTDRFPSDRNFEPREFESLYQEVGNVVELIFKEGANWRAVAFTLQKLQLEDEGLGLELRGIEKRGDLWVVKVAHDESVSGSEVESRLYPQIEEMQKILAAKEQQINKLLGIASDQAVALKELSRKSFGNSFFITGSTITNLTGQGQIEYAEAANQVRSFIASATNPSKMTIAAQTLISQLQSQEVAVTLKTQAEFIQQVLITEAQKDAVFQQFLLQQGQQIVGAMPDSAIASAIRGAIAQLNSESSDNVV